MVPSPFLPDFVTLPIGLRFTIFIFICSELSDLAMNDGDAYLSMHLHCLTHQFRARLFTLPFHQIAIYGYLVHWFLFIIEKNTSFNKLNRNFYKMLQSCAQKSFNDTETPSPFGGWSPLDPPTRTLSGPAGGLNRFTDTSSNFVPNTKSWIHPWSIRPHELFEERFI